MTRQKEIQMLKVSDIQADALQPRRNFSPERMGDLARSVKKHGIMNPIIVEERKGGGYIIVDGERRFRTAKELKLTEVPAVVVGAQSETDRLIQQFHLQEQHENWSAMEKAVAVARLAAEMGLTVGQMAETLSLPHGTVSDYVAFSKLLERSYFEKNQIPLSYAKSLINLKDFAKKHYQDKLNKEFTADQGRKLERAVINRIVNGTIERRSDLLKIRDAIKADPKSADRFISDDKLTPDKMFIDSNAKVGWLYRNIASISGTLASHIESGMKLGVQNMFEGDARAMGGVKLLKERINELVSKLP